MPEKDNTGMGERIQSMVEDAVASMDFEQLNKNITGSIQSVFEELNRCHREQDQKAAGLRM